MNRYVFDIETDGLLDKLTKVHSLVLKHIDTGEVFSFTPQHIETGVRMLQEADLIIGHNIIKFDLPALTKVYPWFSVDQSKVKDTLVLSRLIWSDVADKDYSRIRAGKTAMPMKLAGSHSLEAWGWRLGKWKGDYSKIKEDLYRDACHLEGYKPTDEEVMEHVWSEWDQEMQDYCEQDVEVTEAFWFLIESKGYSEQAIQLEHDVAWIIAEQERNGYGFDVKRAEKLYAELTAERIELEEQLRDLFAPWWVKAGKEKTYKRTQRRKFTGPDFECPQFMDADAVYQPIKMVMFNPGSRDHIADRLQQVRGWKPKEFTEGGKPKVDETILNGLPYKEAKQLAKYFQVKKILGQLGDGDKAWLKHVKNGRIHHSVNTNGAVTGRATHSHPNLAQVPSGKAYKGKECRECFIPLFPDHKQIGCDVSGLELRMLAHFMAKYDDGEYGEQVVNGDVHTLNQQAAGLPTRDNAKTFIYGFLYGAGNAKIGEIVNGSSAKGAQLRKKFLKTLPALNNLINGVKKSANSKGYLKGLDGRLLHVRSDHAALNVLLQSAGALVCKRWLVEFHMLLKEHGLTDKVKQMAWIHDEVQLSVHESLIDGDKSIVGDLCVEAIARTQTYFNIRVPLTGEYQVGDNWKDCH